MSDTSNGGTTSKSAARAADSTSLPTGEAFARAIYHDFARLGTALPKHVTDSIMKLGDIRKIQPAMDRLAKQQDSTARRRIAESYRISVDSLKKILDKGNKEGW